MEQMHIRFNGNKKVSATYKGFTIQTDQPASEGGDDSAPEPFDLFLASLGTCAGVFIAFFCESRKIPTDNIHMVMSFTKNEKAHLMETIDMELILPPEFPEKYRSAVLRAAEQCTVKRTIATPPEIRIHAR